MISNSMVFHREQNHVKIASLICMLIILAIAVYTTILIIRSNVISDEVLMLFVSILLIIIPLAIIYSKHIKPVFLAIIFIVSGIIIYIGFDVYLLFIIPFLYDLGLTYYLD